MKSIKLKIVAWLIGLMCIMGTCIAQDSVAQQSMFPNDTANFARFEIKVKTEPVVVTVETEGLENNEPLQKMMEVETEQTDALNKNFSNLNKTIAELPHLNIEAKQEMLDLYKVYPSIIDRQYTIIHSVWYSALLLYIAFWLFVTIDKKGKLYWSSKNRTRTTVLLVLGGFVIGWVIPKLFCLLIIDNYHLWSNIEKLF